VSDWVSRVEGGGESSRSSIKMLSWAFAAILRDARKKARFTMEQAAERVGYRKAAISNVENCHGEPSVELIFKLSELYDIPTSSLFRRAEDLAVLASAAGCKNPRSVRAFTALDFSNQNEQCP
jgi:transcriptional regulator with XRE-family HTH domain